MSIDEEKRIKHEIWECNEEIKYQKKRLLILKQQLLQLYGEKQMEKEKGRILSKTYDRGNVTNNNRRS